MFYWKFLKVFVTKNLIIIKIFQAGDEEEDEDIEEEEEEEEEGEKFKKIKNFLVFFILNLQHKLSNLSRITYYSVVKMRFFTVLMVDRFLKYEVQYTWKS